MAERIVRKDKDGLFVPYNKRRFYLDKQSQKTPVTAGVTVRVNPRRLYGQPFMQLYGWNHAYGSLTWTTKQPEIMRAPTKKPGTDEWKTTVGSAYVVVKMNHAKQTPLTISIGSKLHLTWDAWDAFVEEINERRENLPLDAITQQLKTEIELEDELDAYLTEKGLK